MSEQTNPLSRDEQPQDVKADTAKAHVAPVEHPQDVEAHALRHGSPVVQPQDVDAHAFWHGASVEQPQDVEAHSPGDGAERADDDETEGRARLSDAEDDVEGHRHFRL